jgi:hypothetical protein
MSMIPPPDITSLNTGPGQMDGADQPVTESVVEETIGNQFLKNIDPRDVPVVDKYIKEWDKGVNQRFREIHAEYEPFKKLGVDIDTIQGALQVYQLLESDPAKVYEFLQNELGMNQQSQTQEPPAPDFTGDPAFSDLPEEFVSRFTKLEQVIQGLANEVVTSKTLREQQEQDQALQNVLDGLKSKFGDFDEEAVLMRMSKGMKPEAAVKDYNAWVDKLVAQKTKENRRPVPPVLGGAGAVPVGTDLSKASRQQSRDIFAQMLAQTNNTRDQG